MKFFNSLSLSASVALIIACVLATGQARANENFALNQSASRASATDAAKSNAKPNEPIRDREGRIRYIVDLVDDDTGRPDKFADSDSYVAYAKDKSTKLIEDVSKLRGVELFGITTGLIGTSFIAHLTEQQVKQFSNDKRVKLITQDIYIQSSALWNSSTDASGQTRPWGLEAMAVANAGSSNGGAIVFVLDFGSELHPDLTGLTAANRYNIVPNISLTTCNYAHATHVAGIIGAADNGFGVVGVFPGVTLVSIGMASLNRLNDNGTLCGADALSVTPSTLIMALQKASEYLYQNNRTGIINLSFNFGSGVFASNGTVGQKMLAVSTPFSLPNVQYKGALIVQSAGNNNSNACDYAYNAASPGIIVVGGLDNNGQAVVPLNGAVGFLSEPLAADSPGSNAGNCVGIWAPSQRVLSTWSGGGYATISGTSMAAPHISGFAARLLASNGGYTPAGLKAAVLSYATTITGSNLSIPRLSLQPATAAPTVDIAEALNHTTSGPLNFSKLATATNLRYQAVGAVGNCLVTVTRNGAAYSSGYYPSTYNLSANLLPPGQYTWSVTCNSAQGIQTNAVATGLIRRPITLNWFSNTTSTGGVFQALANGANVTWSASANAPFSQYYNSVGADYCRVQSSGFTGSIFLDLDNPNFNPLNTAFAATLLWDSGLYYPAYFNFGSFNLGNPNTAAPPLGPYNGYKWLLTCRNSDGESKQTVMYGTSQP